MTMTQLIDNEIAAEQAAAEEELKKAQAEAEARKLEEQRAEEDRKAQAVLDEQKRQAEAERQAEEARQAEERRKAKEAKEREVRRERLALSFKELSLVASVLEKFVEKVEKPEAERGFILPYAFNRKHFEDALASAKGSAADVMLELRIGQRCTLG